MILIYIFSSIFFGNNNIRNFRPKLSELGFNILDIFQFDIFENRMAGVE